MIELKPLSPKRWAHCRSVAAYSYDLALHWGTDPIKAYLAGSLHDIARELSPENSLALARERGRQLSPQEEDHPILLHGYISALIAEENYAITDKEILHAMEVHTLGCSEMSLLDKIIYLADAIEPLRSFSGVEELRHLAFQDLNQALIQCIEQSMAYLMARGLEPHPITIKMQENLLKENS